MKVTKLLTPVEVSALLRVSVGTLANWRWQGSGGPGFVKNPGGGLTGRGARVLYPEDSVQDWIDRNRRVSTTKRAEGHQ